jgi:c-di-GMP-binding flagellar brake protein YcgR
LEGIEAMETQRSKDKRNGIRVPLLSEQVSFSYDSTSEKVEIADITTEGVFVKTETLLKPRQKVTVQLTLPGDLGNIEVDASVVRINWALNKKKDKKHLGMGLRFEDVSDNIKKILDAYVVYLRNKQIITVSKRIIEEFFGSNGPKKTI